MFGGIMGNRELKPIEKICPVLSVGMPEPILCHGKKCMWFHGPSDNEGKCAVSDIPGYMSDLLVLIQKKSG